MKKYKLQADEVILIDRITSTTKMDCWFRLKEKDGLYSVYDMENRAEISLRTAIQYVYDGIYGIKIRGISSKDISAFIALCQKLKIKTEGGNWYGLDFATRNSL